MIKLKVVIGKLKSAPIIKEMIRQLVNQQSFMMKMETWIMSINVFGIMVAKKN